MPGALMRVMLGDKWTVQPAGGWMREGLLSAQDEASCPLPSPPVAEHHGDFLKSERAEQPVALSRTLPPTEAGRQDRGTIHCLSEELDLHLCDLTYLWPRFSLGALFTLWRSAEVRKAHHFQNSTPFHAQWVVDSCLGQEVKVFNKTSVS